MSQITGTISSPGLARVSSTCTKYTPLSAWSSRISRAGPNGAIWRANSDPMDPAAPVSSTTRLLRSAATGARSRFTVGRPNRSSSRTFRSWFIPAVPSSSWCSEGSVLKSSAKPIYHVEHRRYHVAHIRVGQHGVQGKAQHPLIRLVCHGELDGLIAVLFLIEGVNVNRDEMHRGPDVERGQLVDELIAADPQRTQPQAEDVELPGMLHLGALGRNLEGITLAKGSGVGGHDLPAPRLEAVELAQLGQSHGRLHIRHAVLESGLIHLIEPAGARAISLPGIPAPAMQAQGAGPGDELRRSRKHA